MRLVHLAFLFLLLLWPGMGAAEEQGARLLAQGLAHFNAARFPAARQSLSAALRSGLEPKARARAHLYLGLTHAVVGNPAAAEAAFAQALTHDPTLRLDTEDFKPELVERFERVRSHLRGRVRITANEAGATVWLAGKRVGRTPCVVRTPIGSVKLTVRSDDGRRSHAATVVVPPGRETSLVVILNPLEGLLTVRSHPAGARVTLGERDLGPTPLRKIRVPAGDHQLRVAREGFAPVLRRLRITSERSTSLEVQLPRLPAASLAAAPAAPAPPRARRRVWTWVLSGLAGTLLVSALGVGASSNSDYSSWEQSCPADPALASCQELQRSVERKDLAANVLFGTAGAAALTATLLFFLEGRDAEAPPSSAEGPRRTAAAAPRPPPPLFPVAGGLGGRF